MPGPWSKFSELGDPWQKLNEPELFLNLQIGQPARDTPDLLWKAYIDFEISEPEYERTQTLYERFLNKTFEGVDWLSPSSRHLLWMRACRSQTCVKVIMNKRENAFSEPEFMYFDSRNGQCFFVTGQMESYLELIAL
ncbi:UNVERIFIED_CONTAM: Pre-splicing factor clf-1 [Sesamum angustifolium]|uniref:Pre-splicing factor clf-1 n=1 Tax=Sesamum angustifolium TaxID=2727405 RepID=A0AAW2J463_9LAMI